MEARKVLLQLSLCEEEIQVDWQVGYPTGYAKLCKYAAVQMKGLITPFTEGPPKCFLPYAPSPEDMVRLKEFEKLFPIIPEEARDSHNARRHAETLWQQLDHLGNAGFDPALFRVDRFGNVVYWHADPASPLAWEVDHWFPHSRGKNVASNLQIIQWQVNQRKKERLEFLIPWWDLQLGVSVNQFLSAFASKHLEFRNRCFSLYFHVEAQKQLSEQLIMQGHTWPQHFRDKKTQIGLAAAALVSVKESDNGSKDMGSYKLTISTSAGPQSANQITGTPARRRWSLEEEEALRRALQKYGPGNWKEIKECEPALIKRSTVQIKDKYRLMKTDWNLGKENIGNANENAVALQRAIEVNLMQEEKKREKDAEIARLEEHLRRVRMENEKQTQTLKGLEEMLKEHREQVERQRQWAETQTSYRLCLERMIRDAIHQSAVYVEQAKLNKAACNALAAQLETRITECEAAEAELIQIYQKHEALEALAYPQSESNSLTGQDLVDLSSCLSESLRLPESQADEPLNKCLRVLRIKEDGENWVHGKTWKGSQESCDVQKTAAHQVGCADLSMEDRHNMTSLEKKVKEEVGIDMQASQHRKLWLQISGQGNSFQQSTEQDLGFQHRENESNFRATLDAPVSQASGISEEGLFPEDPCKKAKEQIKSEFIGFKINKKQDDLVNQEDGANIEAIEKQQVEQFITDNRIIQHNQSEVNQSGDGMSTYDRITTQQHPAEENQFGSQEQNNQNREIRVSMEATQQPDSDESLQKSFAVSNTDFSEVTGANNYAEISDLPLEGAFQKLLVIKDTAEDKQGQKPDIEEEAKQIRKHNADEGLDMPLHKKAATHPQSGSEDDDCPFVECNSDRQQIQDRESNSESEKPKGILQELLSRLSAKQQMEMEPSTEKELLKEKGHLQNHIDKEGFDKLDPEISEMLNDAPEDLTTCQVDSELSSSLQNSTSQALPTSHFRSMSSSISHSRLDEEDNTLTRSGSSRSWYLRDLNARQQAKPGIKASIRAYTQAWIRTVKKLEARIQESQ